MSFEVEHEGAIVIVGEYEQGDIGIEDVVNPDTGEVLTDDWFENGDIYDQNLREKIKDKGNNQVVDNFLNQL